MWSKASAARELTSVSRILQKSLNPRYCYACDVMTLEEFLSPLLILLSLFVLFCVASRRFADSLTVKANVTSISALK
jgi:hypothetical protein